MAVPYISEGSTDRNPPSQYPISPPQELVQKWINEEPGIYAEHIAARSAQWGWDQRAPEIQAAADAELEACIRHLNLRGHHSTVLNDLRAARRPKPSTLKERALNDLSRLMSKQVGIFDGKPFDTIRQALEALPDD